MSAPISPIGLPVGSVVYERDGMQIVIAPSVVLPGAVRSTQRFQFIDVDGVEYGPPCARLTDAIEFVDREAKSRARDALRADPFHRPEGDAGDYVDDVSTGVGP